MDKPEVNASQKTKSGDRADHKTRKEERARSRAEAKERYRAETDELYREVMSEYPDDEASVPDKPKGSNKLVKRIGIIIFILINAAVIYFTAANEFSGDAPPIPAFTFTNILFLLGGVLCLVVVLLCESFKYMLMMKHLDEKVSFRHAFSTAALGKYYDCITPSGAGGQPFQIYYLHSNGYSNGAASAMPLSGFFTMQFGFVILCLVAFTLGNGAFDKTGLTGIKITAYFGAFAYTVVPVMIIISGIAPKIAMRIVAAVVKFGAWLHIVKKPNQTIMKAVRYLHHYSVNIKKITQDRKLLIKLLLLSTVFQFAMCSMPFFAVHTFGGKIDFFQALVMCVFIQAAVSLIPTPGNAGAAEGSFYMVFKSLGTAGTFWAMLVWRLLCYYSFILIGVLIYGYNAVIKLINKRKENQQIQKAE